MSDTPTEYFGPHARRWTNPRTGVTLSLKPQDYHRLVAEELAAIEAAAEANSESLEKEAQSRYDRTTAETMHAQQITTETMEPGWPNVISMDTMHDRDLEPYAGYFKEDPGVVVLSGGWHIPRSQYCEPLLPSDGLPKTALRGGIKYPTPAEMVAAAQAAAETARAAAHSAEESRDKALEDAGLVMAPGGGLIPRPKNIDWDLVDPDLAKACDDVAALRASYAGDEQGRMLVARILERKAARDANLSNDGSVSPSMPAASVQPRKRPAARHIRKWRISPRNLARLGLVYIIVIIGVIAVAGVMS